ncbi:MAG: hypothetical protein KME18_09385 [Phormidium tanganyikae FI6-MK23]|jgi:hypothetical protein|nr:hypothetical protein [Phormidium tanganyikae FI6-MK23]
MNPRMSSQEAFSRASTAYSDYCRRKGFEQFVPSPLLSGWDGSLYLLRDSEGENLAALLWRVNHFEVCH